MDDDQTSFLPNWTYLYQDKSMDEVRQSVVLTMELEDARLKAEDELKMRDEQILHLKELLTRAIKERDEAQDKCQKMFLHRVFLQQKLQQSTPHSAVSSIDGFSSDESTISSPDRDDFPVEINRPLPEKGKLLQAVMKAGPLLQTLLLAGPLPQWRHPPPPVDAYQIPPPPVVVPPPPCLFSGLSHQDGNVSKCGRISRKRGLLESSDDHKRSRRVL